jgi:dTDP-4-amino-4,6-dideoxygalactose transaminase
MYHYGQEEIDALEQVIRSGVLFRYHEGSKCEEFEERYAKFLGVNHFSLAVSGSFGLAAGLVGLEIGPGDEKGSKMCYHRPALLATVKFHPTTAGGAPA